MTYKELAIEAWRAWVKDKPFQSEDTAKGFLEGFNLCLLGKIKVEGGDKGELAVANFSLQEKLAVAENLITRLSACFSSYADNIFEKALLKEAEQFLEEVEG